MQENMPSHGRELICMNVDKVYDWIVKEMSFDICPTGAIKFPTLKDKIETEGAIVKCKVVPATDNPIVILNRENRTFTVDGASVCLQQLNVQKNFILTLTLCLQNGTILPSEDIKVSRCEQVTLCAPKGTDVEITYTDLECHVCTTGMLVQDKDCITFTALSITVSVCQSIQSTFPVTVEFLAKYCEPRADLPFSCPANTRPKHCSAIFPSGC